MCRWQGGSSSGLPAGQTIYLVPSLDLVVVLTGGNYNAQSPATAIMAKELLPAFLRRR
jgi:hypothetical protein